MLSRTLKLLLVLVCLGAARAEAQAVFNVWAEQSPTGENAFHCVFTADSNWPMSSMDAQCSVPGYPTARRCAAIPPPGQTQAFEFQCSTTGWVCPEGEEMIDVSYQVQATGGGSEWGNMTVDCAGEEVVR